MKRPLLSLQGFTNKHRKRLFGIMLIGLFAYLIFVPNPWKLSEIGTLAAEFAGTLFIFAGILGRIMAIISIGGHKDRQIMQTELYSVCRNPLYFSSLLIAIGVGLLTGRADFTLLVVAAYLAIFYPMMLNEANYLRNNFEDFAAYEAKVPLLFPNFKLWQERSRFEISFRLVKRTLLDASVALLVIPLILAIRAIY
jgi:protein-S-isoprenylcysteine O-methyltransferase Ste14